MKVTVYSTPTCSFCHTVKSYLRGKSVPFRDLNVATNQQAAQDMIRKSRQQGVPVIDIDGKIIVGFNKPAIDKALKI